MNSYSIAEEGARLLLDEREKYSSAELSHRVHVALPRLYSCGLALPQKPESAYGDEGDDATLEPRESDISIHRKVWRSLFNSLTTKIGPAWERYREVFDPCATASDEIVVGSLADDLSDIYVDLAKGEHFWSLSLHDEAVWQWRFGIASHWGEHVTGALRAIRTLSAVHDLGFMPDSATD